MATTRTALNLSTKSKGHRSASIETKKSASLAPASSPIAEFDVVTHRKEIAQVAYLIWLERADRPGSSEGDWLAAVSKVRAKYACDGR
jgi:hypothetical protein